MIPGRVAAAVAVAAASASASASTSLATAVPRAHAAALSSLESNVLADINAVRARAHVATLRLSAPLDRAARAHSEQMAADGYFAHESADGAAFWRRLQSFYPLSGWRRWRVGENLLWSSPGLGAHRALTLWLRSPDHRRNLLDPTWREIGISAVHVAAAPGVYGGRSVTIVTTDFGVRR